MRFRCAPFCRRDRRRVCTRVFDREGRYRPPEGRQMTLGYGTAEELQNRSLMDMNRWSRHEWAGHPATNRWLFSGEVVVSSDGRFFFLLVGTPRSTMRRRRRRRPNNERRCDGGGCHSQRDAHDTPIHMSRRGNFPMRNPFPAAEKTSLLRTERIGIDYSHIKID